MKKICLHDDRKITENVTHNEDMTKLDDMTKLTLGVGGTLVGFLAIYNLGEVIGRFLYYLLH